MILKTEIRDSDWQEFNELEPETDTPYWFKLKNGNVVLGVHIMGKYNAGWAKCSLNEKGEFMAKPNEFYLLQGAKIQPALLDN